MIWKTKHIVNEAKAGRDFLLDQLSVSDKMVNPYCPDTRVVGIVGGGPKGLYALERLFTEIHNENMDQPLRVYWFNENMDFGSGNNYQIDQPDYLLINYCVGNIDVWNRTEPSQQIEEQLDLVSWLNRYNNTGKTAAPTDYASRALVGLYLQDMLQKVISNKPKNVDIRFFVASVTAVEYSAEQFVLSVNNTSESFLVNNLLLATGHCYENTSLLSNPDVVEKEKGRYVKKAYPIRKLDVIPAKQKVGIIGLGLTFIDAVLQLTEGRGGSFDRNGDYIASGNEPWIYPFSRNNIPILVRGPIFGDNRYKLRKQTVTYLESLVHSKKTHKINFNKTVYPALQEEVQFAYYSTLYNTTDERALESYVERIPKEERFTLEDLLFPTLDEHTSTLSFLESNVEEAKRGECQCPLLAASAVWREATDLVGQIYAQAGFTGESQQNFDEKLYGAFCRTSFGPPIANMQKIIALTKAGVIRFTSQQWTTIEYDVKTQQFLLTNEKGLEKVDVLIDARIARSQLKQVNSPLYASLWANSLIRPFRNDDHQPGGPDIDENGQTRVQQETGYAPALFFYGTPTEGILLDNDSLSRKRNDLGSSWAKSIIHNFIPTT